MKTKHTLIYCIKNLIVFFSFLSVFIINAQDKADREKTKDTIKFKNKYSLRVGADVSKLIRSAVSDDYMGFELNADFRFKKNLYIAAEIGSEEKTNVTDFLDITTKGNYIKAGVDYNLYKNWLDMDNLIYSGFRLGYSNFNHTLNNFTVFNTSQYWAPQFSSNEAQEFNNLNAIWFEIIMGLKAEVLKNVYMGLNLQLKANISAKKPNNFTNVYIPGFNKTTDNSIIGVGFGYTIAYAIPFTKNKTVKK